MWIEETDLKKKLHAPLTQEISLALDRFLFNHYCQSVSEDPKILPSDCSLFSYRPVV